MLSDLSHIANDQCPKCNEFIVTGWTCQYCTPTKTKKITLEVEDEIREIARKILEKKEKK